MTRSIRRVALSLGVVAIVALVLAAMALQDIYHQERDVRLEWNIVRIAFMLVLAFTFTAMTALWRDRGSATAVPAATRSTSGSGTRTRPCAPR